MSASLLSHDHAPAIEEILLEDVEVNLFLIQVLDQGTPASWWGVSRPDGSLSAICAVMGGLAVPFATDLDGMRSIGALLAEEHEPYMVVGPREASDALWSAWTETPPRVAYLQRLYVAETSESPASDRLVPATSDDVDQIAELAVQMQLEDLGTDPRHHGEERHRAIVETRIAEKRTLVIRHEDRVAFMVNVGTQHTLGCQIGGTYVPPPLRGRGLATEGVSATVSRLLREYPQVTLHVNEANLAAVTVYERCGFRRAAPFRLLIA